MSLATLKFPPPPTWFEDQIVAAEFDASNRPHLKLKVGGLVTFVGTIPVIPRNASSAGGGESKCRKSMQRRKRSSGAEVQRQGKYSKAEKDEETYKSQINRGGFPDIKVVFIPLILVTDGGQVVIGLVN